MMQEGQRRAVSQKTPESSIQYARSGFAAMAITYVAMGKDGQESKQKYRDGHRSSTVTVMEEWNR
jgi:hypothetical protein